MRKMIALTLIALTASFALAQSPSAVASRVFDRVYATEVPCNSVPVMQQLASGFSFAYCAYIEDQMTDINKRWTAEVFNTNGYVQTVGWQNDPSIFNGNGEFWISGYTSGGYTALAALFLNYGTEGSALLITFDQ